MDENGGLLADLGRRGKPLFCENTIGGTVW